MGKSVDRAIAKWVETNHRTYAEIATELAGVLVEVATELAAEREAHTATKTELKCVLEIAIAASNDAERALREAGLL